MLRARGACRDVALLHGAEHRAFAGPARGEHLAVDGVVDGVAVIAVVDSEAVVICALDRHGPGGAWVSELLPHTAGVAGELCFIHSLHTEAINHDPAVTLMQTGHQQPGRPSFGAWTSYGLGSENRSLPAFVVLISRGSAARPVSAVYRSRISFGVGP